MKKRKRIRRYLLIYGCHSLIYEQTFEWLWRIDLEIILKFKKKEKSLVAQKIMITTVCELVPWWEQRKKE